MNCTNCGSSVVAGAKFCENCGMAATAHAQPAQPAQPTFETKAETPAPSAPKQKPERKMIPTWFVIVAMVFAVLTASGIAGLFIPAVTAALDPLTYALIFAGAAVGVTTLFYIFMLIYFLAKHYGHGSKLIPVLHFVLYALGGGVIGVLNSFVIIDGSRGLYQPQIALALLILCSAVSFIVLCVCLYFLLREHPHE